MKTLKNAALFLAGVIICASYCVAQQATTATPQQPSSVVSNNVQLVIEGKVISVHDGDTVTVLDQDDKKFHIRLQGIDAPELKQEFGSASQQNLSRMVLGKQVSIFWNKVDKYRRTVGTIMLDGRDINIEQVKAGLAWHFKKYEDEQAPTDRLTYAAAEHQARAARLGLWNDQSPVAPGDWRLEVKTKRWGPPPPEGTIIGNRNSRKYHRPDCTGYRDMAERNRVFFKTIEEAEAAGYKRAGNCPEELQAVVPKASSAALAAKPVTSASNTSSATSATATTSTAAPTSRSGLATIKANPMESPPNGNELPDGSSQGTIVGNKNSKVYHLPGCSSYNKVSEKNQVRFSTVADAEAAGYKRAGNCSDKNAKPSE